MERIVVGVDGSEGSRAARDWAVHEARLRGAHLTLLHAWSLDFAAGLPYRGVEVDPGLLESAARAVLQDAVVGVSTDGLAGPVEQRLVCNHAALALIDASRDASLVVVGTRGRGGFAGLLLGSVSAEIVRHSRCPVVVVPIERE